MKTLAALLAVLAYSSSATNDYTYNTSAPVYTRLSSRIRRMKADGKPLRIKINSHPRGPVSLLDARRGSASSLVARRRKIVLHRSAGKTFFIHKSHRTFLGCRLLDFDDYKGARRTSALLLSFNRSAALLGSAHTESGNLTNIAYLYVVPPLQRVKSNIKRRKTAGRRRKRGRSKATWSNETHIVRLRQRALAKVFGKDGAQREPVFYSFEEGLRFCVDAYKN